jgi:lipoate synthase
MSVEKVKKVVLECICERPDCPSKGKPWYSKDETLPERCYKCHRGRWYGVDLRLGPSNMQPKHAIRVEKIVNRCVCEWSGCPGKGKPWYSKDEKIPKRCHWCTRTTWNGEDLRLKSQTTSWVRVRLCPTCGGTEWAMDEAGESVCVHCAKSAHAPGCTCTLCRMKRAKKPAHAIALPKPKRVRNPE